MHSFSLSSCFALISYYFFAGIQPSSGGMTLVTL